MIRTLVLIVASLSLSCSALAQCKTWTVQAEGSSLRFAGTGQGEGFQGRFGDFDAKICFDPAALDTSKFDVTIALSSADTKNEERDQTLKGTDFFDVSNYPKAHFVATEFAANGKGFEANGALELRGVRKPVVLNFTWTPADGGTIKLEGKATLNRMDFAVGEGDWADPETIAHEVKVETTLVLHAAP